MPGNPKRKQSSIVVRLLLFSLILFLFFGVFGDFVFVLVLDKPDHAKWTKAQTEMGEIRKALNQYAVEHSGHYPDSLEALVHHYFPSGVLKDPFSRDNFLYERTDAGFVLICLGKDLAEGGAEIPERDIVFDETGERP